MPYCEVVKEHVDAETTLNNAGVKIFYRTYGHGPSKALLIIGLAGTHESWGPQIKGLTGTDQPNDDDGIVSDDSGTSQGMEVCAFDNRGMGRSSVPTHKSDYTTTIMAKDSISLLDHLGWEKAHVIGHSMGAMIACKLAAMIPERILSLALLNVTGGGFECFPKLDRLTLSIAIRFWMAKTPQQRAKVDLDTHYSRDYLKERIGTNTRRDVLYEQYVKGISETGMQSKDGLDGQLNACWLHKITTPETERIRSAGFLVSVIHGRHDVIAQICHARRLAQRLYPVARMVDLHGGHLVSHERTEEVNKSLLELIKASGVKKTATDWTNLTMEDPGYFQRRISLIRSSSEGKSAASPSHFIVEKFHRCLLFLFGLLVLVYEYARRALRVVKPIKVGPSLT
ncbi:dihydrolipoyllysine-residue acetyltransferase component of acetoin cleaving system-like [Brassica napus]|uniref:dihydrolipoyllysine-residue acetyltransferase component of acetoin cleaving system-like n=1 Tax=Brassica napus TaxID=3708 RepID=UPI002078D6D3|nr:dihydrolipoyllysine-residue acetyltransferase component of acetoin cleaving system-like [Brassica napus]